jgi:hypothetical protein
MMMMMMSERWRGKERKSSSKKNLKFAERRNFLFHYIRQLKV